jgi:Fur family peroxide stress response transcriptional regulator
MADPEVRFIASSEGHPNMDRLLAIIKTQFPIMGQAAVYTTLALLKVMDQVLGINLRDVSHHNGNRPTHHPHLIRIKSNEIMDGDLGLDPSTIRKLEKVSEYQIIRPEITFYGLCHDCIQSSQ